MVKILFVIPTLCGGGAEKVLVTLANKLAKDGFDVTIKTLKPEWTRIRELNDGINVTSIFKHKIRGLKYLLKIFTPKSLAKILRIDDKGYDIIVSYLEGETTRVVSGVVDAKKIAWVHTENQDDYVRAFRSKKEMLDAYKKYDEIVAVSQETKRSFDQCVGEIINKHCDVLYNINDYSEIYELAEMPIKEEKRKNCIRVVTASRLTTVKDVGRMVKIFHELNITNSELQILGDGPERSSIEAYIKKNNITNIRLLGYKSNPYCYIKNGDIFALLSHKEGYSTVVVEALLLNVPIIVTDCSGMREILDNGVNGLIVKDEYDDIKATLKDILTDRQLCTTIRQRQIGAIEKIKKKNDDNYRSIVSYINKVIKG